MLTTVERTISDQIQLQLSLDDSDKTGSEQNCTKNHKKTPFFAYDQIQKKNYNDHMNYT